MIPGENDLRMAAMGVLRELPWVVDSTWTDSYGCTRIRRGRKYTPRVDDISDMACRFAELVIAYLDKTHPPL